MKIHASGEDYLEAVLILQKKQGMVRSIDLARHMGFSKPSISHAVGVLKNGGFLTVDEDGYLNLTNAGREVVEKIYERHQFFTEQLVAVGVDRETAERDACRIEHVISEEAFEKLKTSVEKKYQYNVDSPNLLCSSYYRIVEKRETGYETRILKDIQSGITLETLMAKGHRKTPEEKAAVAKQKRKQRRAKRKKEARDNLTKEEILQDDRFFCIAGYTSGGAPYGVTWEEKDLKPWEDWEENE